ncbi:UvrD-helicase domain-containing protein [Paraburkholderia sp. BR14263]|uniref:UvrD-helicase domain-containing protein n=1 Tax=unclassified Paraburkholderia TaxID=2615204 RepID=UPI0034CF5D75
MTTFNMAPITDHEIAWAAELMGLGAEGFAVIDGDDSRLRAMRNLETCDFEACPGSGKTTLLVAKLAILASRWPYRQRGICVLSHTTAARDEIDQRLSVTGPGAALVRYPHFIGTIHGFVNEYLALPWLRSKGNPVRLIDTSTALKRRHQKLEWKWRMAMEKRGLDIHALQYDKPDYSGANKGTLSRDTDLCRAMEAAARSVSEEGYFCFDEMFIWANELLDLRSEVGTDLCMRFPLVFIDEAQDNSELQSAMLYRIFRRGGGQSIRQRFGDSNQAIYAHASADGAQTDRFPSMAPQNLPRSYRFSQGIADAAKGLGIVPQALNGAGPTRARVTRDALPPVLFLFDDNSVRNVLPRYGEYLMTAFSAEELTAGIFTAIAGVHEMNEGKSTPVPRAMGHYAPFYNPIMVRKEAVPGTFDQYLSKALRELNERDNAQVLVNALASALTRLSELAGAVGLKTQARKSSHRRLLESLEGSAGEAAYLDLLDRALLAEGKFSDEEWEQALPLVMGIVTQLTGGRALTQEASAFLARLDVPPSHDPNDDGTEVMSDNFYSHPPQDPKVRIRLGSIHSVKGETHTATLVLDSFFYKHHLSELKPWILGERTGGMKKKLRGKPEPENSRMLGRLKLHYVAMTRPSHQLCLAMRRDAFNDGELELLKSRGWLTVDCCSHELFLDPC